MASKTTVPPRGRREAKQKLSKALGDAAREARKREGVTQADVAERIGVATEVYGRLERGLLMPSVPTLRRLCLALKLPADSLLALGTPHPPAWAQAPSPPAGHGGPQERGAGGPGGVMGRKLTGGGRGPPPRGAARGGRGEEPPRPRGPGPTERTGRY